MKRPRKPFLSIFPLITIIAILPVFIKDPLAPRTVDDLIFIPIVVNNSLGGEWLMPGANPQRSSWTNEEVRGNLKPVWYRTIEPFILPRVQVIAAYGMLYISTAEGLYAFDANSGETKWIYPTGLPLGHSPTISDGVAYVGGFDRKIHAINAQTGTVLWTFEAEAGFDTNPLVVQGKVFVGNRDGAFYAIYTEGFKAGQLAWKYQTDGPIHYSAAYNDGIVYFASNDGHAYALHAATGELKWKSAKLPGAGFQSWWPVIYRDWVIFAGSPNYRSSSNPGPGDLQSITKEEIFPNRNIDPQGTLVGPLGNEPGDWVAGTRTLDTSKSITTENGSTFPITEYMEKYPWRRTIFFLKASDGSEYTMDTDGDGKPDYPPFLYFGAKGTGTRFPPVVGADGVLYMLNTYLSSEIPGGNIVGWKMDTPHISIISSGWAASDEPRAYTAGGNMIYWKLCCDRSMGAIDISIPNSTYPEKTTTKREWSYFSYNLPDLIPGYDQLTYPFDPYYKPPGGVFGGRNGVYGWHGDESPPVPYRGKVFSIHSNTLVAFAPSSEKPKQLPMVPSPEKIEIESPQLNNEQLRSILTKEVEKIISTGHLRPAYLSSGLIDPKGKICGDNLIDYWHHPGDIHATLIRALPYLDTGLKEKTRNYLQKEFQDYPPYLYNHIGWEGSSRESFDLPPEVVSDMGNSKPANAIYNFDGWSFAPHSFYALWKYAQEFGGAQKIFDESRNKLESPPLDPYLIEMPHVHNAYIAGYWGYLELELVATGQKSSDKQKELDRLLELRVNSFSKDTPDSYLDDKDKHYCRTYNISRNFMYMVPELASYLHDHTLAKVQQALNEYQTIAPYWFVPRIEAAFAEAVNVPLYDYHALFQAKAMILREPQKDLVRYIDIPATKAGDLFYIDNLVAALEAEDN
jgi:hypothetical protein